MNADQFRRLVARSVPRELKDSSLLRYVYGRLFFGRIPNERNSIILFTQTKSGTYFFAFMLASYLRAEYEGDYSRLDFSKIAGDVFFNSLSDVRYREKAYVAPHPLFRKTPYSDLLFGHADVGIEFSPARILALYRNPLDFLVSNYYYRYVNRKSVVDKPPSVDHIVDEWLPYLIKTYTLMDKLAGRKNALEFSYEELTRTPEVCLATAVRWLGLPLDDAKIRHAVANSRFDAVREFESSTQRLHAEADNYTGKFFTRSGKIGEWRDEFSEQGVDKVRQRLEAAGINFSRFVLD